MKFLLAAVAVSLALAGCAKPRAAVIAEPDVLQVPSPPPRVIVPPEPEPEPPFGEVEPLKDEARAPRRNTPRPDAKTTAGAKPGETLPPATVEPPPSMPPVASAPGALQPVVTSPQEVADKVRGQLQRARADLDSVDYTKVSADARAQYDMAQRFIEQARQALTERNLLFAGKLAEKAANIAAGLAGR